MIRLTPTMLLLILSTGLASCASPDGLTGPKIYREGARAAEDAESLILGYRIEELDQCLPSPDQVQRDRGLEVRSYSATCKDMMGFSCVFDINERCHMDVEIEEGVVTGMSYRASNLGLFTSKRESKAYCWTMLKSCF